MSKSNLCLLYQVGPEAVGGCSYSRPGADSASLGKEACPLLSGRRWRGRGQFAAKHTVQI